MSPRLIAPDDANSVAAESRIFIGLKTFVNSPSDPPIIRLWTKLL